MQSKCKSLTWCFWLSPMVDCLTLGNIYKRQHVMKQQPKYAQNQKDSFGLRSKVQNLNAKLTQKLNLLVWLSQVVDCLTQDKLLYERQCVIKRQTKHMNRIRNQKQNSKQTQTTQKFYLLVWLSPMVDCLNQGKLIYERQCVIKQKTK